jgi:hypothetical protein
VELNYKPSAVILPRLDLFGVYNEDGRLIALRPSSATAETTLKALGYQRVSTDSRVGRLINERRKNHGGTN